MARVTHHISKGEALHAAVGEHAADHLDHEVGVQVRPRPAASQHNCDQCVLPQPLTLDPTTRDNNGDFESSAFDDCAPIPYPKEESDVTFRSHGSASFFYTDRVSHPVMLQGLTHRSMNRHISPKIYGSCFFIFYDFYVVLLP